MVYQPCLCFGYMILEQLFFVFLFFFAGIRLRSIKILIHLLLRVSIASPKVDLYQKDLNKGKMI